jgi:hypothetical protein
VKIFGKHGNDQELSTFVPLDWETLTGCIHPKPTLDDVTVVGEGYVPIGAVCDSCNHLAGRHSGIRCAWNICECEGFEWDGKKWIVPEMETSHEKQRI